VRSALRTVLLVTALAAAGLSQTGTAMAQPSAAETLSKCATGDDRGVRCMDVSAKLDRSPAAGQRANLSVRIRSLVDIPNARVEIDLPAALKWTSAPEGYDVARHASALPDTQGAVSRAERVTALTAGRTMKIGGAVEAVGTGDLTIRVRVLPPAGYGLGVEEPVLATVGTDAASSRLGLKGGPSARHGSVAVNSGTKATPLTELPAPDLGTKGLTKPHTDDARASAEGTVAAAAISCVKGSYFYNDAAGVRHPSVNLQVQVWDEDPANSDDLLAVGLTDGSGAYHVCFDNSTDARGGQDVYLNFVAQNGQWGVEWDDDPWTFDTDQHDNVGDGTTTDFGGLQPADPRLHGSLRAYDDANTGAAFTPGDCWDRLDHDCRRIDINWDPDENPGTFYRPGEDEVYLTAQDADDRNVVVHELGHAVMDDVYEDDTFNTGSGCANHQIHVAVSAGCAWSEGFGDWFGVAAFGDPVYRDTVDQNQELNLDTATWGSTRGDSGAAWENGDQVEGRVAGALWDLIDTADEQPWDLYGDGLDAVWNTFLNHRSTSFAEYWAARGQDGRNVGAAALGSLYQNTIDYGFRNPLADHQSLLRPTPVVDHNYRFDTTKVFWSVVALRPPSSTVDYDLRLYDDSGLGSLLTSSVLGPGVTDFVAVNSNRRAVGDYYPQVHAVTGTGDYRIEADETEGIFAGTPTITMGANRLAALWDICLSAGERATYTVTPSDSGQDAELFVLSADSGGSDNVLSRSGAVASSDGHGAGDPESVTVDLPEGCHGLVVVNKAGSGAYTVAKS